ncbi:hypothetical protein SD70_05475 [Gordoniibacillus kamchatkensis]|uniref:DUF4129 domain-containing protein n=1 Tax=Gordoniibacillus kamchatkensis TaxID=1590651 RepID=A0ABR5AL89_9BACL|nr:DUF4129 domain-containing protein [Paenibacillus sp. VKM B-2647]KIL41791.1 hypothetical protein SD70_05475 [Paenibacillus sp. VKM B-2647]
MERQQPEIELNGRIRRLLLFWLRGVTELLLYAPVWLIPAVYGFDTGYRQLLWLFHLPLAVLVGALSAHFVRRVWLRGVLAFAAGALEGALLAPTFWWPGALIAAGSGAAVWRGMAVTSAASRAADVPRYGVGIATYAISGIVCSRLPEWSAYMPWLTAAGIVSLAILLFRWNGQLLQRETLSAESRPVPAAARRHNRLMVAAVIVLSTFVAAATSEAVGRMLLQLLRELIGILASAPGKRQADVPPPPQPPPPQLPPPGEPGWLARALDLLVYVAGIAAAAAAILLLARSAYRRRREIAAWAGRMLARIAALLGRASRPAENAGYTDEESVIWSWELAEKALKRSWLRRFAGGAAGVRWNELRSNGERVRYLYRQWLGRLRRAGFAAPGHLTPEEIRRAAADWEREAAAGRSSVSGAGSGQADKLIELYYKARYSGGDGDIADEDVELLRRESPAPRHKTRS